ncbi:MAG: hypothetical protein HYZ25_05140 [Chloroflexi bacterium]|nr:hypothetical protein [Chloroflexota bacterium]
MQLLGIFLFIGLPYLIGMLLIVIAILLKEPLSLLAGIFTLKPFLDWWFPIILVRILPSTMLSDSHQFYFDSSFRYIAFSLLSSVILIAFILVLRRSIFKHWFVRILLLGDLFRVSLGVFLTLWHVSSTDWGLYVLNARLFEVILIYPSIYGAILFLFICILSWPSMKDRVKRIEWKMG